MHFRFLNKLSDRDDSDELESNANAKMWSPVPEPWQSYIEFEVVLTSRDDNGHDDNSNDEDDEDDGHPCPSLDNLQGIGHAGGNCGSGGTFE